MVRFFVVLKTGLFPVTTSDDARIDDIFQYLKSESYTARRILGRSSFEQYDYYMLKNPVPIPDGGFHITDIVRECLDKNNWQAVSPHCSLGALVPTFLNSHVYMVIQPREGETGKAIADLNTNFADIFGCLEIKVSDLHRWTMQDVSDNLEGGRLWRLKDVHRPAAISAIEELLTQRLSYNISEAQDTRDYQNARHYNKHFDDIFVRAPNASGNVTNRAFATFFSALRCFDEDSARIQSDSSSTLKASNFMVYFLSPPFFSCPSSHYEFQQEKPWGFPIFLSTQVQSTLNSWYRFRPRSDFIVSSPSFLFPFLISEVAKEDTEGRPRMLLQAIAAARAGQCLMEYGAPMQFFVVAIYLRANLSAERYIVAHTGPNRQVSIAQKDFDLFTADGAVAFLREMYNLVAMIKELAGHLDKDKQDRLFEVNEIASKVISLTSMAEERTTAPSTLDSITDSERSRSDEDEDELGIFGADDIQAILKRMKYKINFIPFGYPFIASVSHVSRESEKGYLKFVGEGRKEIEILQYLAGIDSPANHTISGFRVWPVHGGNVILMPVAGSWITHLKSPNEHLWSAAKQLFEAVDFMHQHGVAHLDLKPQNVLIPVGGGRLSLIDFNRSVRVNGIGHKFRGIVGTPGYMAPEVAAGEGRYSAIRADLWSCGKTLEDLCLKCRPSVDRDTLLEISRQLMDEDPEKRPTMSDVLDRVAHCTVDASTRPDSPSSHSFAPPEVNT